MQKHKRELGADVDLGGYVAAGVVAFDLRTRAVRWQQHLDLSTDSTALKAYTYAAPTLADLDGDGSLEVIIGTSMACPLPPHQCTHPHVLMRQKF